MPLLCRRRRKVHRNHRSAWQCCRNPIVVFLLSFLALGSLRFRTRTKQAARNIFRGKHKAKPVTPSDTAMSSDTIQYIKTKEGTFGSGTAYQQYQAVSSSGDPLSVLEWFQAMADNAATSDSLTATISASPYGAVFFETPAATASTVKQPFEFVLVDAPRLDSFATKNVDKATFQKQFRLAADQAATSVVFENLGKDATLIVPKPQKSDSAATDLHAYGHLAAFVRHGDTERVRNWWKMAATAWLDVHPKVEPLWCSTSGMGVAWLHLRLDRRPKYYTFDDYKKVPVQESS